MDVQLAFDFWGAEEPETKAAAESDRSQHLRFEAISQMIAGRRAPVWAISRKIAAEMANIIKQMKTPVRPFQRHGPHVDLNSRMKALRELQRTLMEGEALTKRDALDLDGPKFMFVRAEIVRLFQQALNDAGTESSQTQDVMVQFGDLMEKNDEALRRELDLIAVPEMEADHVPALPVLRGVGWSAVPQQQSA